MNILKNIVFFLTILNLNFKGTLAYRYGLNEGDQLISVNGVDFRTINHFEAVKLFKESIEFLIVAKYSPYGNLF